SDSYLNGSQHNSPISPNIRDHSPGGFGIAAACSPALGIDETDLLPPAVVRFEMTRPSSTT
ncbi:hypothetical protein ACC687_42615, partial [Rhizobium ruizarguesonis]